MPRPKLAYHLQQRTHPQEQPHMLRIYTPEDLAQMAGFRV